MRAKFGYKKARNITRVDTKQREKRLRQCFGRYY